MEFSDLCAYTFSTSAQNEKLFPWKFQTTDYDWLYKKVSLTVSIANSWMSSIPDQNEKITKIQDFIGIGPKMK